MFIFETLFCAFAGFHFFATDALTTDEQKTILNYHNSRRSELAKGKVADQDGPLPTGQNIYRFSYNTTMEKTAQENTKGCSMEQNSSIYGENTFFKGNAETNFTQTLIDAADTWWAEKDQCQLKKDNLTLTDAVWEKCGHLIPMASSANIQIGCAISVCGPADFCTACSNTTKVDCLYYNPQNDGSNPVLYEKGPPCSADSQCTQYQNSTCDKASGLCKAAAKQDKKAQGKQGSDAQAKQKGVAQAKPAASANKN